MHGADPRHGVALAQLESAPDAASVALRLPVEERENDRHVLARRCVPLTHQVDTGLHILGFVHGADLATIVRQNGSG